MTTTTLWQAVGERCQSSAGVFLGFGSTRVLVGVARTEPTVHLVRGRRRDRVLRRCQGIQDCDDDRSDTESDQDGEQRRGGWKESQAPAQDRTEQNPQRPELGQAIRGRGFRGGRWDRSGIDLIDWRRVERRLFFHPTGRRQGRRCGRRGALRAARSNGIRGTLRSARALDRGRHRLPRGNLRNGSASVFDVRAVWSLGGGRRCRRCRCGHDGWPDLRCRFA